MAAIDAHQNQFWTVKRVNGEQKIEIDKPKLLDFCTEYLGYHNVDSSGNFILVKIEEGSIIKEVKPERLKQDIKAYLRNDVEEENVWREFATNNLIDKNFQDLLTVINLDNTNISTKDTAHLYYRNGVVLVSKSGIKIIAYSEYAGYVWEQQINDRTYLEVATDVITNGEFSKFIGNVSGNGIERKKSLITILGYLMHPYKDSSLTKAVIFLDENVDFSGQAHGGTGKSLLVNGIGKITRCAWKDGKRYKPSEQFALSTIRPYHRVLYFDDITPGFSFSEFYSIITGDVEINQKYKQIETLPFSQSPKLVITSNYIVQGSGGATDARRRIEFEVAPYYSIDFTPAMEFGHNFFDDWDADEWNLFDNAMIKSIQYYLACGLIYPPSINLTENKLIAASNADFVAFVDEKIVLNTTSDKTELLSAFIEVYPEHHNITGSRFKKWLDSWAEFRNRKVYHTKSNSRAMVRFEAS